MQKKRTVKWIVIGLIFLILLFALMLVFTKIAWPGSQTSIEPIAEETNNSSLLDTLNTNNEAILDKIDNRESVVFGLYGTDEKVDDAGRSDIIMVVSYNPIMRKCIIASFPRDLRVNIPGYGMDKINHAYAYGGMELLDQTIEELMGFELDYSVKVDFETFSKIIDDFGGVTINAQKDFPYNDGSIAINQGEQVLNGKDALYYVRFRSDADGDYGRIARQQEVVIALIEKVTQMGITKIDSLINKYYKKGIETNASLLKLQEYVNLSSRDQAITFENYRLKTTSQIIDGLWYELYNQEDLDAIRNLFIQNQEAN